MNKSTALGLLAGAALLAGGCQNTSGTIVTFGSDDMDAATKQIQENRYWNLSRHLRVTGAKTTVENGLTKAIVSLQSQSKGSYAYQYQVNWTDAAGAPVTAGSRSWKTLELTGYAPTTVTEVAPSPEAKSFSLAIRRQGDY